MDKKEIYEAVMSGSKTKKEIADELGINYTEVCRILKDQNNDNLADLEELRIRKKANDFATEVHSLLRKNIKAHIFVTIDLAPVGDDKEILYVNIRMKQFPIMNFKWREAEIMRKIDDGLTPLDLSLNILETYERYLRNIFFRNTEERD